MLTLTKAATETGVSKSTLSRAIKAGRLSAVRNDVGGFLVDPAELFRTYPRNDAPLAKPESVVNHAPAAEAAEMKALRDELANLLAQNASLRVEAAQGAALRELVDDLKAQRDAWQRVAEQRLLTDQRPRRGLFGWLKAG